MASNKIYLVGIIDGGNLQHSQLFPDPASANEYLKELSGPPNPFASDLKATLTNKLPEFKITTKSADHIRFSGTVFGMNIHTDLEFKDESVLVAPAVCDGIALTGMFPKVTLPRDVTIVTDYVAAECSKYDLVRLMSTFPGVAVTRNTPTSVYVRYGSKLWLIEVDPVNDVQLLDYQGDYQQYASGGFMDKLTEAYAHITGLDESRG